MPSYPEPDRARRWHGRSPARHSGRLAEDPWNPDDVPPLPHGAAINCSISSVSVGACPTHSLIAAADAGTRTDGPVVPDGFPPRRPIGDRADPESESTGSRFGTFDGDFEHRQRHHLRRFRRDRNPNLTSNRLNRCPRPAKYQSSLRKGQRLFLALPVGSYPNWSSNSPATPETMA